MRRLHDDNDVDATSSLSLSSNFCRFFHFTSLTIQLHDPCPHELTVGCRGMNEREMEREMVEGQSADGKKMP